jgi:hypothetical protein
MDGTEQIDMTHRVGSTWTFIYILKDQPSLRSAPVGVDISDRTYSCRWLEDKGGDTVVGTADIDYLEAEDGYVEASMAKEVSAAHGPGDVWFYLEETQSGEVSILAEGWITLEDVT